MVHHRPSPATLYDSKQYGYSQVVQAEGSKIIYCAGQTAWDTEQNIIGPNDFRVQTRKTLENVGYALEAASATPEDIISLRIYIVDYELEKLSILSEELKSFFGPDNFPANSVLGIDKLALPEFMIEIEAMAVKND